MTKTSLFVAAFIALSGLLAAPLTASAAPLDLEIVEADGDSIIIASGITLKNDVVHQRGDRIELDLVGTPTAQSLSIDNPVIRRVDIRVRSNRDRRLSILLRRSRDQVRRLAKDARVAQIGDDLQLVISGDPARAPIASFRPSVDVEEVEVHTTPPADTDDEPIEDETDDGDAAAGLLDNATTDSGGGLGGAGLLLVLLALAAGGALLWRSRRKSADGEPVVGIEVLSSRQVGPKARIVLLAVGPRELLLSISPAGAEVLARWDKQINKPRRRPETPAPPADIAAAPLDIRSARSWRNQRPVERALAAPMANPYRRDASPLPAPPRNEPRGTDPNTGGDDYASYSTSPAPGMPHRDRRGSSPAIRGILELRDQTLNLANMHGDNDAAAEWEQALANGTQAGRIR